MSHARLFDPIRLRGAVIPNRIVMPPMTTRLAATDGSVTAELITTAPTSMAGHWQWFYTTIRKPDARLAADLGALGIETRRIGDCRGPGRTLDAIAHAVEVANQL